MLLLGSQMVKLGDGSMKKLEDLSELTAKTIETANNDLVAPKTAWGYAGKTNGYFDFKISDEDYFLVRVTGWINNDAVYKKDAIVFYEDGEGWACLYSSGDEEISFYTDASPQTPEGSWIRFFNTSDMKVVAEIIGLKY